MFPQAGLSAHFYILTDDRVRQIRQDSGVNVLNREMKVCLVASQVFGFRVVPGSVAATAFYAADRYPEFLLIGAAACLAVAAGCLACRGSMKDHAPGGRRSQSR